MYPCKSSSPLGRPRSWASEAAHCPSSSVVTASGKGAATGSGPRPPQGRATAGGPARGAGPCWPRLGSPPGSSASSC
eukprot:7477773-Lingulodinium_polyedra.AAC.1